ncbi:MAG: PAS domain S-box protein [Proteobacteria bacterium]|nr:PAS domain S-box protein [Pseudomonadota bacterium]
MNYKKLTFIVIVVLTLCFCLFAFRYEQEVRQEDKQRVVEHGKVIAHNVWNFNTQATLEYLTLASESLGYERITVRNKRGEVVRNITSRKSPPLFSTPVPIQTDIIHKDKVIGSIEVVARSKTIYTYFYVLLVCVMLVVVIHLYLRILNAKSLLERRVRERTMELSKSEEKFRGVVEKMNEGLVISDSDMIPIYVNPKMCEIAGSSEQELMQTNLVEYFDEKNLAILEEQRTFLTKGGFPDYFAEATRPDGSKRTLHILTSPLYDGEQINSSISIMRDITEELKTQELLIQNEKMMSVGGLAAGMAHELNNPLAGMMNGAQNVQRRLSPDLKSNHKTAGEIGIDLEVLQSYLEKRGILSSLDSIRRSGEKAAHIISNMIQFARNSQSEKAPVDLEKLMENTLELAGKDYDLKKMVDFRYIEIVKEFDSNLPLVQCSETEIEQVVLNLLNNANWAMIDKNGDVPPKITLRTRRDGPMARIEIEDNGHGMDERTRKRIFEPFFTTKPVGQGTGLGLSVSYAIVTNNHGGTIEAVSEPGKGTNFIIRLPLNES